MHLLGTQTANCGNMLDNPASTTRRTPSLTEGKWNEFLSSSSGVISINPCVRQHLWSVAKYKNLALKLSLSSAQPAQLNYTLAQPQGALRSVRLVWHYCYLPLNTPIHMYLLVCGCQSNFLSTIDHKNWGSFLCFIVNLPANNSELE
jgi:hypothetical protein